MVDQNTIISMTNANFTESTYTNNNKKKNTVRMYFKSKAQLYIVYR